MSKRAYLIQTDSVVVLVAAYSAQHAEREWDALADQGDAESRVGPATRPTRREIREIAASPHDYR